MSAARPARVPPRAAGALPALALVCNPYHRGGITRWMVDMAAVWAEQGGACWFVAPRPRRPFATGAGRPTVLDLLDERSPEGAVVRGAPSVGREFEFGTETYRTSVYADAIARAVPEGVPVVGTDDPATWQAAAWLADRNPFVGVVHADHPLHYDLVQRFGAYARAAVCVSRRIEAHTRALGTLRTSLVTTIPCGTRLGPVGDADEVRPASAPLRVLWVGRMDEEMKRVSDLPAIAERLHRAGLNFELDIIGDGAPRESVAAAVAAAGLADRVRLLGWRPPGEVQTRLREADVMLLPSKHEGMSVAVMEALAAGCAVVASRISGNEDYEHNPLAPGALWLHDVGDVDAAARMVQAAAAVPRARRVRAARALAEAEFSIERCVDRYADLLRSLPAAAGPALPRPRRELVALASYPVAAQRVARLWARRQMRAGTEPA